MLDKSLFVFSVLSHAVFVRPAFAIEYATGPVRNTTVTQVSGTRTEAVQLIEPVLTGVVGLR
ncbi:MAG: hypothetical protein IPK75_20205 [Acidobacteria bacterium]|nr:hypothetical protein [Acidobacteriota bacterium]